jgi:hypothetical protein
MILSVVVIPIAIPYYLEEWKERKKKKAHAIVSEHLKLLCDDNGNLMEYEEAMMKLAEIGITDKIDIITYSSMRSDMRYEFRARGYSDGQR